MEIRPARTQDAAGIVEIDGTVESAQYLHLDRSGEGLAVAWRLEPRALRTKHLDPNRLDDDTHFAFRQFTGGGDDGLALIAEHEGQVVALLLARADPARGVLEILDLRVDYEHRRQGLATALLFQAVNAARDAELRAVTAHSLTNNHPAAELLLRCGFELAGLDPLHRTNHDLVREQATLIWYAALQ